MTIHQRPRSFTTQAIVLRHSDLGDADRLLTLITPDHGLLRGTAKGARRPTSRLGGHLDLLCQVAVSVHVGRSLYTITQVETVNAFRRLRSDIRGLSCGLYLAELAQQFSVEDGPSPPVFNLLAGALESLCEDRAPDVLLRWFELRILSLTGFQPELRVCAECEQELQPREHVFSAERGGVICQDCRSAGSDVLLPAGVNTIKVLRHLSTNGYDAVAGLSMGDEERRQVERILQGHLERVLDRPLRSSAFVNEVRGWSEESQANGETQGRERVS
ncbi:MAG: DNA repair protein RecO [Chloroflexota bacterium]